MVEVYCRTCLGLYKTEMCRSSTHRYFEMVFTMANIPWYWPDVLSRRLNGLDILYDLYLYDH